jgi:hypothetical protein
MLRGEFINVMLVCDITGAFVRRYNALYAYPLSCNRAPPPAVLRDARFARLANAVPKIRPLFAAPRA